MHWDHNQALSNVQSIVIHYFTSGELKLITMYFLNEFFLFLTCILCHTCIQSQSETPDKDHDFKKKIIDNFVENLFLSYSGVQGLGLTIVQNDNDFLYTRGYGYANLERGIKNGNETQFLLGSVTKSFTALVVVNALHESFPELGEAVLDTPIMTLLPYSNFTLSDRFRTEHATFRDLLSHKMCFPRDDFQLMTEPFQTTAEILYRQRFAEESCGFRTRFLYNNHMVLWASELIGQMANRSFLQITNDVLREIGMFHSEFIEITDNDSFETSVRAQPYYIIGKNIYPMNSELMRRLTNIPAIGGLYSTPNDMSRFLRFQLNLGKIDGKQVIPKEVMSWLTKPSSLFPKFSFRVNNDDIVETPLAYGLGLTIGSYDGWQRISHNGYFAPYRTEISWYPGLNIGIFTGTHEAPANAKQQILHKFILDTLRGKENATEFAIKSLNEQKLRAENDGKRKTKVAEKFMGQYKNSSDFSFNILGKYGNRVSGEVEISRRINPQNKEDVLYLKYGKWGRGWLAKVSGDGDDADEVAFKIIWDTDLTQDYYAAGDRDGLGFVIFLKDGSLEFVRPTAHGMATYAQFQKGVELQNFDT